MSLLRVDRPIWIIDSINDIEDLPKGTRAGQLYFLVGNNPGLYGCFDGSNIVQISGSVGSAAAAGVSFDDTTAQLGTTTVQGAIEALKVLIDAL